jgi:hypothetical protein
MKIDRNDVMNDNEYHMMVERSVVWKKRRRSSDVEWWV